MDDRVWWFANKIQDVFKIGAYDSPTLLEDFISDDKTSEVINSFLRANGKNRLFVHGPVSERASISGRVLTIHNTLPENVVLEGHILLYFFRLCTSTRLDTETIPTSVFSGVVKESAVESFTTYLSDVITPILKSTTDWGNCTNDQVTQLLASIEKCVSSLTETSSMSGVKVVLEPAPVNEDPISRRLESATPQYIAECERLIISWASTIESFLMEAFEESRVHLLESTTGPMVEIQRWKRRRHLLQSIIEQLKAKESKAVITTLIANKTKHVKKWRSIDVSLTDALNEAKDKHKYLESMKRHLEPLCDETKISEVIKTCLPQLIMGVKQWESASRHYSKSGFLGVLLNRVTNQLVSLCRMVLLTNPEYNSEAIWGSETSPPDKTELDSVVASLTECLALHKCYKDCLKTLREMLGTRAINTSKRANSSITRSEIETESRDSNLLDKKRDRRRTNSQISLFMNNTLGIAMTDEISIAGALDRLIERSKQLIDVINVMHHLDMLSKAVADIGICGVSPHLTKEHLNCQESGESFGTINDNVLLEEGEECQASANAKMDAPKVEVEDVDDTANVVNYCLSNENTSINTVDLFSFSQDTVEPDLHVSVFIKNVLKQLYALFKESCSSLDVVLSIDNKNKDVFVNTYARFNNILSRFELVLCCYIKSVVHGEMPIRSGLEVISKFSGWRSSKFVIKQALLEAQMDLFTAYEDELENIKAMYEDNKDSPPRSPNAPAVASAIIWIRQLVFKIEEPMKAFRENKVLMNNKDSVCTIKLYNKLASTFCKFEHLWVTSWSNKVDAVKSALKATLLVKDNDRNLHVNMDPKLLELLQEIKWMIRLKISVPDTAKDLIKQETRIKTYTQKLEQNVKDMKSVVQSIPAPVKPVLSYQLHNLQGIIQPGLVTLTWANVNIDGFLHRMTNATNDLKTTHDIVQNILATQVETHLSEIPTVAFFEGREECLSCEAFVEVHSKYVNNQYKNLSYLIKQVQAGLYNCVMSAINAANKSGFMKKTPDDELVALVLFEYHSRIKKYFYDILKVSINRLAKSLVDKAVFTSEIELCVPKIVLSPPLKRMQEAIDDVLEVILSVIDRSKWLAEEDIISLHKSIDNDNDIQDDIAFIKSVAFKVNVVEEMNIFNWFEKYWRHDLHAEYRKFFETNIDMPPYVKKVEEFHREEDKIRKIASVISVGVTRVNTSPVKYSISAMIRTWKYKYASQLHVTAKRDLECLVEDRETIRKRLTISIENLSSLSETLDLLSDLSDLENTIDDKYLPVETTYQQLTDFQVQLPRQEVQLVKHLRDEWALLMNLADSVRQTLMIEQKLQYEQELTKQVQSFTVEVIQFRTSFEAQGPGVSNISPHEAMDRLKKYWATFEEYSNTRKTLQAVQKMYGIPLTSYPDLTKTGSELALLQTLYDLYQKYIDFDINFKATLWQDVNLDATTERVNNLYTEYNNLDAGIKAWNASATLLQNIEVYLELLPVLVMLNSHQIRSRHWIQVMQVTSSNFQLESSQMRLCHLLDCDLLQYQPEIREIVNCASKEQELEIKLRGIEEEWSEQLLHFSPFKNRGLMTLNTKQTLGVLELLEDSQASLASMLTSKHIGPLRDEAAIWAAKLLSISEVIEQWLAVQRHWKHLEAVFSLPATRHQLPHETKRFHVIDKTWSKLMKRSFETKNLIQCCHGGDTPKGTILSHLSDQLDYCQRSLGDYLNDKRKLFPRFYYISDSMLLAVLSSYHNIEDISPYIRAMFKNTHSVVLSYSADSGQDEQCQTHLVANSSQTLTVTDGMTSVDDVTLYSDAPAWTGGTTVTAIGISSVEGEVLNFNREVSLTEGVEVWLNGLLTVTQETLTDRIYEIDRDMKKGISVEDYVHTYPCQVVLLGFCIQWTRDCETAILDNKTDRRAVLNVAKKYSSFVNKMPAFISRIYQKPKTLEVKPDEAKMMKDNRVAVAKWENLLSLAINAREVTEDFQRKKIKEITDFEWLKNPRYYLDDNGAKLVVSEYSVNYGCEYFGCNQTLNPQRDKNTLVLVKAINQCTGVAISGESPVSREETVRNLASMCGRFLLTLHCSSQTTSESLIKVLTGLSEEGSWGCFSHVLRLSEETLQVLAQCIHIILGNLQQKNEECSLVNGQVVSLNSNFAVFTTKTTNFYRTEPLPDCLKGMFRLISISNPNINLIIKTLMTILGFKSGKILMDRLLMVKKLTALQLKPKDLSTMTITHIRRFLILASQRKLGMSVSRMSAHGRTSSVSPITPGSDRKTRASTPVTMTSTIRQEHALVQEAIRETFGSRFVKEDLTIFEAILRDVFAGTCDNMVLGDHNALLRTRVIDEAESRGFETHKQWYSKALELHQICQSYNSVIIAGPPAVGKSSVLSTLVGALSQEKTIIHKLIRVNPLSMEKLDTTFGCININGEWVDGIFTAAWKKASSFKNSATWLVMDSPLTDTWADILYAVMARNRHLILPNGDRLFMEGQFNLLFETDTLDNVSPSIMAASGILYMESDVLGWEPLSNSWLNTRSPQDTHTLRLHFSKIAGPVINYTTEEVTPIVAMCSNGLFKAFLALLTAMLDNFAEVKAESNAEILLEKIVVFSLVWSYGGLVPGNKRPAFSELIKSLTSCLPEYADSTVYDYYVDEGGEWDSWYNLIPDYTPQKYGFFVENLDTTRTFYLMRLAASTKQNILLTGPGATGKTAMINRFLKSPEQRNTISRNMVCSSSTKPSILNQIIESTIKHRQGNVYGAENGKVLCLFVDDLNTPEYHPSGAQLLNEYLRSLLDCQGIYDKSKAGKWKTIEDFNVISAMRTPSQGTYNDISSRVLRHFIVFEVPHPNPHTLYQTIHSIMTDYFNMDNDTALDISLHECLVKANCDLLESVRSVLKTADVPGRYHYCFSMNSIISLIKGIQRTSISTRNSASVMQLLWLHEVQRVFIDALCRPDDIEAVRGLMAEISDKSFAELKLHDHGEPYFVTFDDYQDVTRTHRLGSYTAPIYVKAISNLDDLRRIVLKYCQQLSDEEQRKLSRVLLSDVIILHILKIHRVVTMPGGNLVCVAAPGSPCDTLVNLATFISGTEILTVSSVKQFSELARTALRVAGSEGRPCVLFITNEVAHDRSVIELINSALISGEIPFLFTPEEMDGLFLSLQVVIRKDAPELSSDPTQFFKLRVKKNLRIVLSIHPDSVYINSSKREFKGILSQCQILWLMEWPKSFLMDTCQYYLSRKSFTEGDRDTVVNVMTNIHSLVQSELNPNTWDSLVHGLKQTLLMESLKFSKITNKKDYPEIGMLKFEKFLEYFISLYQIKNEAERNKLLLHKEALETISSMAIQCRKMSDAINKSEKAYANIQQKAYQLLVLITQKSAMLEKLKAYNNGSGSDLLETLHTIRLQMEELEDMEFLDEEYDPSLSRVERRKKRKERLEEKLKAVKAEEATLTVHLDKQREEVDSALLLVNRNCVESIKVMPSPPSLVVSVMSIFIKMLQLEKKLPDEIVVPVLPPQEDEMDVKDRRKLRKPKNPGKMTEAEKKDKKEREQWLLIQAALQDGMFDNDGGVQFSWEEGMKQKTVDTIKLMTSRIAADKGSGNLDMETVKYASENVAHVYSLMLNLVAYHEAYQPVSIAREQGRSLESLLTEMKNEEDIQKELADADFVGENSGEEILSLESEIRELQAQYEDAVVQKKSLHRECMSLKEKLKAMTSLTSVLKSSREKWGAIVKGHQNKQLLLANCILSAAFLAYCGSLYGDARREMYDSIKLACNSLYSVENLLQQSEIKEFVMGDIAKHRWRAQLVPDEQEFFENTMLALHPLKPQWILLYDSEGIASYWIERLHCKDTITACSYYHPSLKSSLETALSDGSVLVVTEVDDNAFSNDTRFTDLMTKCLEFNRSEQVKLLIGEKEIIGRSGFKLYIICNNKPTNLELISKTRLLNITPSRGTFTEFFLQLFLSYEKNRIQEDQKKFSQEIYEQITTSSELENEILKCLSENREELLSDIMNIKKLSNLKKHHSEALENLEVARNSEANVSKSKESYRSLAVRAAAIYRVSMSMSLINPIYRWSLDQFLPVFKSSVKQSDRTTLKALLEQLTTVTCITYSKGLFPEDKSLFLMVTFLEIEDSVGKIGPGEIEYLIAPISELTARSLPRSLGPNPPKKKTFEWIGDDQWQNTQVLLHHCTWFSDIFEKVGKDGSEGKWRQLFENECPENGPFPDNLDKKITRVQKLMLVRALRPGKLLIAAMKAAAEVMGKKSINDSPLDISNALKTLSNRTPILMIYDEETENPQYIISELAYKRQQEVVSLYVGKQGQAEQVKCEGVINRAMQKGQWVHLHAVQDCAEILLSLLVTIKSTTVLNSNFRLWLSCKPVPNFPQTVLQSCYKVCTESPAALDGHYQFLRDGVIRSLTWITPEHVLAIPRTDWLPLLTNICLVHNILHLRGKLSPNGWTYRWSSVELCEAFRIAVREFSEHKVVHTVAQPPAKHQGWIALRYCLAELIYGAQVCDFTDRQVIHAIVDYFINPAACKRDFELAKGRWKLPGTCFQIASKNNVIQLIISGIENNPPPETKDMCLMQTFSNDNSANQQHFLLKMSQICGIDLKEVPIEPVVVESTPAKGSVHIGSGTKSRERSPIAIKSAKEVDLIETAHLLLQRLPKGWSKEYMAEKVRKMGGLGPYTYFMTNEMKAMQKVLDEIRRTLVAIKTSADDQCIQSAEVISVASDILQHKVPRYWVELAGTLSTTINTTLSWVGDLVQRCSHLERALMQGKDKNPCIWISVFFNSDGLLGSILHDSMLHPSKNASQFEELIIQTEITNRDKDHIREGPSDGVYVYGMFLYGAGWERTVNERFRGQMQDIPPKVPFTPLPVIHVTAVPKFIDKTQCLFKAPVYSTRSMDDRPVFTLDVYNENVHQLKWALKGVCASLR